MEKSRQKTATMQWLDFLCNVTTLKSFKVLKVRSFFQSPRCYHIDIKDCNGWTVLMFAAYWGHTGKTKIILQQKGYI